MPTLTTNEEGATWGSVPRGERIDLPRETLEWLIGLDLHPDDRERLAALYEKAREGTLTQADKEEIEDICFASGTLERFQAAARKVLRETGDA